MRAPADSVVGGGQYSYACERTVNVGRTTKQLLDSCWRQTADVLGLDLERIEGKQKLVGKSGMTWEVEGKGGAGRWRGDRCHRVPPIHDLQNQARSNGCARVSNRRRWAPQAEIMVTPIGVQQGGEAIARHEGIQIVQLDASSTTTDYVLKYLNKVLLGATDQGAHNRKPPRSRSPGPTTLRRNCTTHARCTAWWLDRSRARCHRHPG